MKFMHVSDVHLGVKPDAGKSWSEKRAQDIWDSFAYVMEVAAKESPDFLLISGDLFHRQPLKRDLKEVCGLFSKIPETNVILMAGNHDYIQQTSYYRSCKFPANVFFFPREKVTCFDFPEKNTAIYGLSYWQKEIKKPLYDMVHPNNAKRINVLLAHGGDAKHIPFLPKQILNNGFDYVAAGHLHKPQQLVPGRAVMAGALEPIDCNDIGPHGYWIGTVEKGKSEVAFFPIRKCEYCEETLFVTPQMTEYMLMEQVKRLFKSRPDYQYFHLRFVGKKDPDITYEWEKLGQMDRVVRVTEQLLPDYHFDKIQAEHENSLLGAYISRMKKKKDDTIAAKALEYGVGALLGHQICR